jgi:hypothetical protein
MRYSEQLFDPAEKGYDQNYFNEDFPMQPSEQLSDPGECGYERANTIKTFLCSIQNNSLTPESAGMKELIQ